MRLAKLLLTSTIWMTTVLGIPTPRKNEYEPSNSELKMDDTTKTIITSALALTASTFSFLAWNDRDHNSSNTPLEEQRRLSEYYAKIFERVNHLDPQLISCIKSKLNKPEVRAIS